MQEIIKNRTLKKKEFLDKGSIYHEMHIGDIHYEYGGNLVDVDYHIEEFANYWQVEKASYRLYISKDFLGSGNPYNDKLFVWRNRRVGSNHGLSWQPFLVGFSSPLAPTGSTKTLGVAQSVNGVFSQSQDGGNGILTWRNAFGKDIDFQIMITRGGIRTILCINNIVALNLVANPGDLVLHKQIEFEGAAKLRTSDLAYDWDKKTDYETSGSYYVYENSQDMLKRTIVKEGKVWDSQMIDVAPTVPDRRYENVRIIFAEIDGVLTTIKVVSRTFLESAIYPIYTDASTAYADTGGDGYTYREQSTWNDTHDGDGENAYPSNSGDDEDMVRASLKASTGKYMIQRGHFPFDLSGESSGTVDSATLSIFGGDVTQIGGPTDDGVTVGDSGQADGSSLVAGDYNNFTIDSMPEFIDSRPAITTWHTDAYHDMTLNSNGRSCVESALGSGYATLGLREKHHDVDDNAPGSDVYQIVKTRYADYTGTGSDPKLTWTLVAAAPTGIIYGPLVGPLGGPV